MNVDGLLYLAWNAKAKQFDPRMVESAQVIPESRWAELLDLLARARR